VPAMTSRRGFENHSWKYLFFVIVQPKNRNANRRAAGGVGAEQDKDCALDQVELSEAFDSELLRFRGVRVACFIFGAWLAQETYAHYALNPNRSSYETP